MAANDRFLIYKNTQHFNSVLERARQDAFKDFGYNTEATQRDLASQCEKYCGYTPKEWQINISEALLLKINSVLIAGTGAGKTTPFVLPLMENFERRSEQQSMLLLISPLKVLQTDQACSNLMHILIAYC
jgi:superfamily II DNA/RNA helicase